MHDDVRGGNPGAAVEQVRGTENYDELVGLQRVGPAMGGGHHAVCGEDGRTADGGADSIEKRDEQTTLKQFYIDCTTGPPKSHT